MSRGYPSMTALLGLLAIAGYQNRDKIAEMLRGGAQPSPAAPGQVPQGTPGNLGGILGGASIGEVVSGGLRELMDAFKQQGHGEAAELLGCVRAKQADCASAIGAGDRTRRAAGPVATNRPVARRDLSRLSKNLPEAVDKYTPQGRIPSAADFS